MDVDEDDDVNYSFKEKASGVSQKRG